MKKSVPFANQQPSGVATGFILNTSASEEFADFEDFADENDVDAASELIKDDQIAVQVEQMVVVEEEVAFEEFLAEYEIEPVIQYMNEDFSTLNSFETQG